MIRLVSVNKYFNRHKKNEIHVINNVSYTFPKKGLVAILGPSGSGKTTLLNAIGGLLKVSSGSIYLNDYKITKTSTYKLDEIRTLNIGYIFQDYKLIDNLSVFDNVAISLKLIGIKDEEEIKKRVLYTLNSVGMERYKNRKASMLSGGERQRVGIARALVKNPKIIIADEPTGNLDSKNSLEVMNIIKNISSKYLVILVTHEEELARFYASHIVEIKDGIITDSYENNHSNKLKYEIENNIYLKDYEDIKNITDDKININVYRNHDEDINLDIVIKNGSIYLKSKNNSKLEVIDNNSNINLINDHYKEIDENNMPNKEFNILEVSSDKYKEKYSNIFSSLSFITYGFKKIFNYPFLKKVLLGGFFLSGMFIFYAISNIMAKIDISPKDYINFNKDYLTANVRNIKIDDYLEYEKNADINYILPNNSLVSFRLYYDKFLQSYNRGDLITGSLSNIDDLDNGEIIKGRMPNNNEEIVVDKLVIDKMIEDYDTKAYGFKTIDDFLNHDVYLQNMLKFTIVGITDKEEPNIYASKDLFINIISNSAKDIYYDKKELQIIDYKLVEDKIKLVKGRYPSNDYEVILNINEDYYELNEKIDLEINKQKLTVVGYYESAYENNYLVNNNMIKYNLIENADTLSISSQNKDKTLKYFRDKGININNSYEYSKDNYLSLQKESIMTTLIVSGIILLISLIEIYLMIRASFLSRIKEVGIYRAIGIKKSDIYKMFSGEILAITCLASVLGITFMAYILYSFRNVIYIGSLFKTNLFTYLFSIVLVFIFNLVVGLFPVFNTIRKMPAEILSRTDVD